MNNLKKNKNLKKIKIIFLVLFSSCTLQNESIVEHEKQIMGAAGGILSGATSGAITGFQTGSGSGPGAIVGAGIGAVAGGIQGNSFKLIDDENKRIKHEIEFEKGRLNALNVLKEHYTKRTNMHPSRDIFPADVFFKGDEAILSTPAKYLIKEIIVSNSSKKPWSRLLVSSYVKSNDIEKSYFSKRLSEDRAKAITNMLVTFGVEPRRIISQAVIIKESILLDPYDAEDRYNQVIEFSYLDK